MEVPQIQDRRRSVDVEAPTPRIVIRELPARHDGALRCAADIPSRHIQQQCAVVERPPVLNVALNAGLRRLHRDEGGIRLVVDRPIVGNREEYTQV